ncbi:MAG: hypothetical protein JSV86_13060 [Gemmatimonadota bacterium]|nr:MAG: hypothetical protein JSV86_13060 [Gemmatimonadota bacterium]
MINEIIAKAMDAAYTIATIGASPATGDFEVVAWWVTAMSVVFGIAAMYSK